MYLFDFYHPALEDGTIFLRFFRSKQEYPVCRAQSIEKNIVAVANHSTLDQIADKQEFTIYTGDQGDYYADV